MQDCSNSIANVLDIQQFCIKPSNCRKKIMACCKTVVFPLPTYWKCHNFAPSLWNNLLFITSQFNGFVQDWSISIALEFYDWMQDCNISSALELNGLVQDGCISSAWIYWRYMYCSLALNHWIVTKKTGWGPLTYRSLWPSWHRGGHWWKCGLQQKAYPSNL